MTAALTKRLTERLADAINDLNPQAGASHLTMGFGELLASLHNEVVGGTVSHLTTPASEIIEQIRNELAAGAEQDRLTTAAGVMLGEVMELIDAGQLLVAPEGFAFAVDDHGSFAVDMNGAYYLVEIT